MLLNRVRMLFWNMDPGQFQLKQSSKTILAICISLWLMRDEALITQVMAGVASGFSMQGVTAKTWILRLLHVGLFIVGYSAAFSLGLWTRGNPIYSAMALVFMGFFVNYIRRFGLEKSIAPLMAWMLCFLATILPFTANAEPWTHIYGLWVGVLVGAMVTIFIFPENYSRLFVKNSNLFFKTLANELKILQHYFVLPVEKQRLTYKSLLKYKETLSELIDTNQVLQHSPVFLGYEERINHILVHQYAFINATALLLDALAYLLDNQYELSQANQVVLSEMSRRYKEIFASITIDNHYRVTKSDVSALPNFTQGLVNPTWVDTEKLMVLLNLKLSFDLYTQQLVNLLRNPHAA